MSLKGTFFADRKKEDKILLFAGNLDLRFYGGVGDLFIFR